MEHRQQRRPCGQSNTNWPKVGVGTKCTVQWKWVLKDANKCNYIQTWIRVVENWRLICGISKQRSIFHFEFYYETFKYNLCASSNSKMLLGHVNKTVLPGQVRGKASLLRSSHLRRYVMSSLMFQVPAATLTARGSRPKCWLSPKLFLPT